MILGPHGCNSHTALWLVDQPTPAAPLGSAQITSPSLLGDFSVSDEATTEHHLLFLTKKCHFSSFPDKEASVD